ncbi:hypothetical protein HPB51_020452 [Rhipicephalus microplus]|uniref:Uncharacterized protein n=1 Tax=Rhipicephalus microplus TaxID=6941 RepID=A0A9J6EP74_RHIMP|nr:hypothetical protein HPB51_020452 [Rhipicephalus microplus]
MFLGSFSCICERLSVPVDAQNRTDYIDTMYFTVGELFDPFSRLFWLLISSAERARLRLRRSGRWPFSEGCFSTVRTECLCKSLSMGRMSLAMIFKILDGLWLPLNVNFVERIPPGPRRKQASLCTATRGRLSAPGLRRISVLLPLLDFLTFQEIAIESS